MRVDINRAYDLVDLETHNANHCYAVIGRTAYADDWSNHVVQLFRAKDDKLMSYLIRAGNLVAARTEAAQMCDWFDLNEGD